MHGLDLTLINSSFRAEDSPRGTTPLYGEIRTMLAELAADFAQPRTSVYEIGCASASVLPALHGRCSNDIRFVCIDESEALLARRREQLASIACERPVDGVRVDLNQGLALRNASVALMVQSLGLARPLNRAALIADVRRGLNDAGCLLLIEPVRGRNSLFNNLFARHRVARRAHPRREPQFTRPRDPGPDLEAIYTLEDTRDLLLQAGFRSIEVFFEWYGTCGIAAMK